MKRPEMPDPNAYRADKRQWLRDFRQWERDASAFDRLQGEIAALRKMAARHRIATGRRRDDPLLVISSPTGRVRFYELFVGGRFLADSTRFDNPRTGPRMFRWIGGQELNNFLGVPTSPDDPRWHEPRDIFPITFVQASVRPYRVTCQVMDYGRCTVLDLPTRYYNNLPLAEYDHGDGID